MIVTTKTTPTALNCLINTESPYHDAALWQAQSDDGHNRNQHCQVPNAIVQHGAHENPAILFPVKLHQILSAGFDSIISWGSNGLFFIVHKPQEFVQIVLPRWFRQSKLESFQRQLREYGFIRLPHKDDKGAYCHEFFLRDKPELARDMGRNASKGIKTSVLERQEADRQGSKSKQQRVSFPDRLHLLLRDAHQNGLDDIVSWAPHGRCFAVHKPEAFLDQLLPRYFCRSTLPSFHRQLYRYGFTRLTLGQESGSFYHDYFVREKPDLAHHIKRDREERRHCKGTNAGNTMATHSARSRSRRRTKKLLDAARGSVLWQSTPLSREEKEADTDSIEQLPSRSANSGATLDSIVDIVFFGDDALDEAMIQDFCCDWSPPLSGIPPTENIP